MAEEQQEKQFVRRLMCAKCDKGNMDFQYLNLPMDHGVYFQNVDQPLMNANDHVSGKHIFQFGRCKAPKNPGNFVDNLFADSSNGILKWIDNAVDKVQGALGCDGCKCKPMVLNSWEEGDEANRLEGAPAITSDSHLHCMYGGIITITEAPASTNSNSDDDANQAAAQNNEPQEKDPMDTIPAAMKDKINSKNEKAIEEYNAAVEAVNAAMAEAGADGSSGDQGSAGEMSGGAELDLSMLSEDMAAMLTDTEYWYKDNCLEFIETNRVSEEIIEQNYMHNRTQMIDSNCLNEWGFIKDCSFLNNFNMASSNAAKIGKSCAASYNLMQLIEDPEPFPSLIREFEGMQTCPGYMDGGPLPITMYNMGELMERKGYSMQYSYGNSALMNWNNMKAGDVGVWGTVEGGETSFFTFKADEEGRINCMEDPDFKMELWSNQINTTQNMFIKVKE